MKNVNDFYLFYEEKLKPIIDKNTVKLKAFKRIDMIASGVIAVITLLFAFASQSITPLIVVCPVVLYLIFKKQPKFAYPDYRMRLIGGIVSCMGDGFSYRYHDSLGRYDFENSGISFEKVRKYDISDIISGDGNLGSIRLAFIKGYKYSFKKGRVVVVMFMFFVFFFMLSFSLINMYSDMEWWKILLVSGGIGGAIVWFMLTGKNLDGKINEEVDWVIVSNILYREDETINIGKLFEGLFLSMEFNKDFTGQILGITRSWTENFLSSKVAEGMEEVELENAEFMDEFCIYATDQQEARYLLTPQLVESLYGLKQSLDRPMNFSFAGSKLFVTFEMEDLLELGAGAEVDSFDKIIELYICVSDIMQTAGHFGLDRRIWTKK